MKKLLLLASIISFVFSSLLANPITPETTINSVIVYSQGALVSHVVDTKGLTGKQTLKIKGMPLDLDPKSLIVEAKPEIDIISINSAIEYKFEQEADSLSLNKAQHNIGIYQDSIAYIKCFINALESEYSLIEDHDELTTKEGDANIEEVIKASEFYRIRIKEIELELLTHERKIAFLNHEITKSKQKIKELNNKHLETENVITLTVDIKRKDAKGINIKYYTPKAGWYPYYDLKVNNLADGIKLLRKAYVSQNTGDDWNNVSLTLSNANPKVSARAPSLTPYNIIGHRYTSSHHKYKKQFGNYDKQGLHGQILDEEGLPLIGVNIIVKGTTIGTITDMDGFFSLPLGVNNHVTISYTGYATQEIRLRDKLNIIQLESGSLMLEEVVITGYGSQSSVDGISYKKRKALVRQPVNQAKIESINSVEYMINIPFSLKSDNKELDVLLEESNIPSEFEYFTAPIKSEKAYLIAKIPQWHKLDLLAGKANLYLMNTYKGSSEINPKSTEDTLSISLGIDPEVIVDRTLVNDMYDKKFFKKNVEEFITYDIEVRNNKTREIKLTIVDQIPVSFHEDVEIKLTEKSKAKYIKEKGFLEWNENITAGQKRTYRLSYQVKYPKTLQVNI